MKYMLLLYQEPDAGPDRGTAELLRRAGATAEAREAYDRAIALTANDRERAELERRRGTLGSVPKT